MGVNYHIDLEKYASSNTSKKKTSFSTNAAAEVRSSWIKVSPQSTQRPWLQPWEGDQDLLSILQHQEEELPAPQHIQTLLTLQREAGPLLYTNVHQCYLKDECGCSLRGNGKRSCDGYHHSAITPQYSVDILNFRWRCQVMSAKGALCRMKASMALRDH